MTYSMWSRSISIYDKPKRPYRSLSDFRLRCLHPYSNDMVEKDANFWPCLKCHACGTIYDPNDPPCPIEGNKLRNRIKCFWCGGTGRSSRTVVKEAYSLAIGKWATDLKQWLHEHKIRQSIYRKLNNEERKYLGILP